MVQVYVSYAAVDNRAAPGEQTGFVSTLVERLAAALDSLGPPHPKLVRDLDIEAGDDLGRVLAYTIHSSDILLVVLSPAWMSSEWCRRDLECFVPRAGSNSQHRLENIVIAEWRRVEKPLLPPLLQGRTTFQFFRRPEEDGSSGEQSSSATDHYDDEPTFHDAATQLAVHIREKTLAIEAAKGKRAIFVAQPARDMADYHQRLVSQLRDRGHSLSLNPAAPIPRHEGAATLVREALAKSDLSIHLLGELAGYAPQGGSPIVKLQLSSAADHMADVANGRLSDAAFRRLIWAPQLIKDPSTGSDILRNPEEVLSSFGDRLPSDKLFGDTFGAFWEYVSRYIEGLPNESHEQRPAPISEAADRPTIFISWCSRDEAAAVGIVDDLEREGFKCWISNRDVATNYQREIVQAINVARAFVLVFSNNANDMPDRDGSDQILKEIALADRRRLRILPVRIEDCEPLGAFEYELANRQYFDLFRNRPTNWSRLVAALKSIAG